MYTYSAPVFQMHTHHITHAHTSHHTCTHITSHMHTHHAHTSHHTCTHITSHMHTHHITHAHTSHHTHPNTWHALSLGEAPLLGQPSFLSQPCIAHRRGHIIPNGVQVNTTHSMMLLVTFTAEMGCLSAAPFGRVVPFAS